MQSSPDWFPVGSRYFGAEVITLFSFFPFDRETYCHRTQMSATTAYIFGNASRRAIPVEFSSMGHLRPQIRARVCVCMYARMFGTCMPRPRHLAVHRLYIFTKVYVYVCASVCVYACIALHAPIRRFTRVHGHHPRLTGSTSRFMRHACIHASRCISPRNTLSSYTHRASFAVVPRARARAQSDTRVRTHGVVR